MKKGVAWVVAVLLAVVLLAGCDISSQLRSDSETASRASTSGSVVTGPGYTAEKVDGNTGPGSLYTLYMPTDPAWNGSLIIYTHGYVAPDAPVALPSEGGERDAVAGLVNAFVPAGFGVAFSSYSENGWAVKDGITRTRQLIGMYASQFGKPQHTYIIGVSMGAAIAVAMAEKNPELIDGVIAISGPVGGTLWQFGYLLNARVAFDYYYPGLVEGDAYHVPAGLQLDLSPTGPIVTALIGDFLSAVKIAAIDQVAMAWDPGDPSQLVNMIGTALWFSVYGTNDALERTHGHIPLGNADVTYTGPLFPLGPFAPGELDAFNLAVERYTSTPDAENYMDHWYVPTGKLGVPVVTLHNLRDPAVPYSHEAVFRDLVDAAGRSSFLKGQILASAPFGHGVVTPEEVMQAFALLIGP